VREEQCPFCGESVPAAPIATIPRVARIALVSIGAAAVATACSNAPAPMYGGPPDTGSGDSSLDAYPDIGTFYGGPPIDSGNDSTTDSGDAGKSD
jgi:hypothetical protein